MASELAMLVATTCAGAAFVSWPAVGAWRRRARSREASEVALALDAWSRDMRRVNGAPPDAALIHRLGRLRPVVPETAAFLYALELPRPSTPMLADAAQRLSLRVRRRVAFERKVLARTRSGLLRGTVAAALPPLVLLALIGYGMSVPPEALALVLLAEAAGCALLCRQARVEV